MKIYNDYGINHLLTEDAWRLRLPFWFFAILFSFSLILLTLFFSPPSQRDIIIKEYLIDRLLIICPISTFLTLMMTRWLRDVSTNVFINNELPFGNDVQMDIHKYLQLIFSISDTKNIKLIKLNILIRNQLHISIILSIILGIFAFFADFSNDAYGIVYRINQDGLGVAGASFIGLMLIFIVVNIFYLLKQLAELPEANSYDQILKLKNLWALPVHILYIYCIPVLITIPVVIISIKEGVWLERYANVLGLLGQIIAFSIVSLVPGYYVFLLIKNAKNRYLEKRYRKLRQFEYRIDDSYSQTECAIFNAILHNVEAVEKINELPSIPEIIKILITALLSIIPILLNLVKVISM